MDEKVIEQLKATRAKVDKDESGHTSSLLAQIRQKELEISGKVLEAKKQAESIVADARKKAAVIVQQADEQGLTEAQKYYENQMSESREQAKEIEVATAAKVSDIEKQADDKLDEAVTYIVNMVTPTSE